MKIAISIESITKNPTGIGKYTKELIKYLKLDSDIDEICLTHGNNIIRNNQFILHGNSDLIRKNRKFPFSVWTKNQRLRFKLNNFLFHGPNYFLPNFVKSGVITVHDLSVFQFPETHPIERLQYFEKNFPSSLERAIHVITDTRTIREDFIKFTGYDSSRVTAIPLGVSHAYRPHEMGELSALMERYNLITDGYALCVSTIEPRKKIGELLEAWRGLPRFLTARIPLVLVGGVGWLSAHIEEMIARGVSEGWLRYLGYVPENDLPGLFAGATLFLYPSAYEGFGLPPIEAMASGVPTIVSDRSCLPEVTRGAAMLVNPDDIEGFTKAIERGLTDGEWRMQAKTMGLTVAAEYTWGNCAQQTRILYKKIIACR